MVWDLFSLRKGDGSRGRLFVQVGIGMHLSVGPPHHGISVTPEHPKIVSTFGDASSCLSCLASSELEYVGAPTHRTNNKGFQV